MLSTLKGRASPALQMLMRQFQVIHYTASRKRIGTGILGTESASRRAASQGRGVVAFFVLASLRATASELVRVCAEAPVWGALPAWVPRFKAQMPEVPSSTEKGRDCPKHPRDQAIYGLRAGSPQKVNCSAWQSLQMATSTLKLCNFI